MKVRHPRRLALVIGALVVVGVVAGVLSSRSTGGSRALPAAPTAAQLTALRSTIMRFAAANGENNPSDGQLYRTTRQAALDVTDKGASIANDSPVYVVVIHGAFTAYGASPPKKFGGLPTGHVLTIVVDPNTDDIKDYTLSQGALDLSSLGSPAPLDLPSA